MSLRWVAGLAVAAGGAANGWYLGWYRGVGAGVIAVGAGILAYNVALWLLMLWWRDVRWPRAGLIALAWLQILADLTCLTLLTVWTGGSTSPVLGFYVFHMVFASLLLPRLMAYAAAGVALALVAGALSATGQWPKNDLEIAAIAGWGIMLLGTVHLANHITRNLRRQRARLQRQNRRVRAMTRQLRQHQQQMIQQEKMVAMGQMAAGVAHEVANPLASMDALLQMMERKPDRIRPDAIARLREQIARINQIVRQMTAFARPGEGQWELADLNAVVGKALEVLRFDPRVKRVTVERQFAPDLPATMMLTAAMEQVIVNLIINALDAMEHVTEPRLTVRTAAETVGGTRMVRVEVRDNGQGIRPEHIKRLFEPFFTTKPVGKGTGLGLSISYSLIRKHGGEIAVNSEPGKGTAFMVTLPVERSAGAGASGEGSRKREGADGVIATAENSGK